MHCTVHTCHYLHAESVIPKRESHAAIGTPRYAATTLIRFCDNAYEHPWPTFLPHLLETSPL